MWKHHGKLVNRLYTQYINLGPFFMAHLKSCTNECWNFKSTASRSPRTFKVLVKCVQINFFVVFISLRNSTPCSYSLLPRKSIACTERKTEECFFLQISDILMRWKFLPLQTFSLPFCLCSTTGCDSFSPEWKMCCNCQILKGAGIQSVWCECVATYSGRLAVARLFIRQQQLQHSSGKLLSWCGVYLGYVVPLPWCT